MSFGNGGKASEVTEGPPPGRRPYRAPSLVVYGNLARITDAVTFMGNLDGGTKLGMRKTGG